MSSREEDRLHQEMYSEFHNDYPDLRLVMFHVRNEGDYSDYEKGIIKSLGLTRGVSDLCFYYDNQFYGIEVKTDDGTQSDDQKKWQEAIVKQGGIYHIVRTVEEFKSLIISIAGKPDERT